MDRYSKVRAILCLLFATALAEQMIKLEDIEKDNLRAESVSISDNPRSKEASYSATDEPATGQPDYRQEPRLYQSEERSSGYIAPRRMQDKYTVQPVEFEREAKFSDSNVGYEETSQPIQRYSGYNRQRQVETAVPNGLSHASTYEPAERLFYQQEVPVGNQYQTVQQKAATERYAESPNREILYVDIPMSQLLSYYPNLSVGQPGFSKIELQPLPHRLASEAARKIAIPVYDPSQSREPIDARSKVAYRIQPQFSSQSNYPQHTEAILPTRQGNELIYAQTVLSHERPPARQAHRYVQEIVYARPGAVYAPEVSSSHGEVYAPPSVYLRVDGPSQSYAGQSRDQRQYASHAQPETHHALHAGNLASQLTDQIYQQHSADNAPQSYEAIPESPSSGHDLPRLPAKNFHTGADLRPVPVASLSDDSHYTRNHLDHSSEPRSLLDSYVPSRLIASQDSERYQERPIRLERGFLPSKINFVRSHEKRGTE